MSGPLYRRGLVLGKFYPLHAGHSVLIRTALTRCDEAIVMVLASQVESIPLQDRMDWVAEEHPNAVVVGGMDDDEVDFDSPAAWDAHMITIRRLLPASVDAVFTGDPYGAELAARLDATWVSLDRRQTPVMGRAVRADLDRQWSALGPAVRASLTQRVVVLGAESTGSTTLAQALAAHYRTHWVPEYGRTHTEVRVGGLTAPWRADEFDLITERQIAAERHAARRAPRSLIICDTDVLATAVWFERYVGGPADHLLIRAAAHRPLAYVLSGDEIGFVQDGLRDGEHIRSAMQQRFRELLENQPVPWAEVRGSVPERLDAAAALVDGLLPQATVRGTARVASSLVVPPGGSSGGDPMEQVVEVVACESPVEGFGGLVVTGFERGDPVGEFVEAGGVVGGEQICDGERRGRSRPGSATMR